MPDNLTPSPATTPGETAGTSAPAREPASVLVCLPPMSDGALSATLAVIATAFPAEPVLVATPNPSFPHDADPTLDLIPYTSDRADLGWVLAAGDYAVAATLCLQHNTRAVLLLSDNASTVEPQLLRDLATSVRSSIDLALPRFHLGPGDGLVNAALLYPLSRALFGADIRFPLAVDAAFSPRMAQRLTASTQRLVAQGQASSLIWPVAEAAIAGFSVRSIDAPNALPPQPPHDDFNTLFSTVAGSLFTDVEAKAAFWQRARNSAHTTAAPLLTSPDVSPEILSASAGMIESFHLAHANLQEIWALVLPPQSRLALKKLSLLPAEHFSMEPALWARIVYDFALAFHLRTLNRAHLLGAMTPLYLAWAASHLITTAEDPTRAAHAVDQTATAFDFEKSYFVSRWRWPDRFNP